MRRIGLTFDELLASTWTSRRPAHVYAARSGALGVLAGETLALVGPGSAAQLDALVELLPRCLEVEGAVAAAGGTLRIHAQQAARVGVRSLVVSEPFGPHLDAAARSLAVADLAGLSNLGLTTVVATADANLAALAADRVAHIAEGGSVTAYPIVMPTPRSDADVAPVTQRLQARLHPFGAR